MEKDSVNTGERVNKFMLETRRMVTFTAERFWNCVPIKKTCVLTGCPRDQWVQTRKYEVVANNRGRDSGSLVDLWSCYWISWFAILHLHCLVIVW